MGCFYLRRYTMLSVLDKLALYYSEGGKLAKVEVKDYILEVTRPGKDHATIFFTEEAARIFAKRKKKHIDDLRRKMDEG
jgi:hypothetical protein